MKNQRVLLIVIALFALMRPGNPAQDSKEPISIQVNLYRSILPEDRPLDQVTLFSPSTHPRLGILGTMLGSHEPERKAFLEGILFDSLDLEVLYDLGFFEKSWPGKEKTLSWKIADNETGFLFSCAPNWASPNHLTIALRFLASHEIPIQDGLKKEDELRKILEATSDESKMLKILNKDIILAENEPIVIIIPYNGVAYVAMVTWTRMGIKKAEMAPAKAEELPEKAIQGTPKPIHQVIPAYPSELRGRGVKGEVKIRLTVDPKGNVVNAELIRSVHPYLDYSATQALLQWKFAPFLKEGKPIAVTTVFTFDFDPQKYSSYEESSKISEADRVAVDDPSHAILQDLLEDCAEYCQKLENAALYFVCEERINEIHGYFNTGRKGWILSSTAESEGRRIEDGGRVYMATLSKYRVLEPDKTEKNRYVCDYQLIRGVGKVQERRIIIKKNGRETGDQKSYLEDSHYSVLMPIFAAIQLLSRDRQPQFQYKILSDETTNGIGAYVIEAVPKLENAGSVERAKIWVAKGSLQILKIETEGIPLSGYDDIFREAAAFLVRPTATITHTYAIEKNGIMFPSRVSVRVRYPTQNPDISVQKLRIDMEYDNYRFFTVKTEHEIIKQ
jgi:TonB family protein